MKTRKLVSVLLVCMMVMSFITVNAAEIKNVPVELSFSESEMIELTSYSAASIYANYTELEYYSVSQHITLASGSIAALGLHMPSFDDSIGTATATVYKWQGSYSATLNSTPIAKRDFINQPDNAFCKINVGDNNGDILIHLNNGSGRVGVWLSDNSCTATGVTQTTYKSGTATSKCLSISYVAREKVSSAPTSRNAYSYIEPNSYNMMSGAYTETRTDTISGTSVTALRFSEEPNGSYTSNDGYALYKGVNFGSTSPKRLSVRVYVTPNSGEFLSDFQFVIDSLDGTTIASARPMYDYKTAKSAAATYGDSEGYWQEMVCDITTDVTGVHDLYILNRGKHSYSMHKPVALGRFKFLSTETPVTHWEKELAEYTPVSDSDLRETYADTWVATDALGRKLPDYNDVGAVRDRNVFMFYWITNPSYVGMEKETNYSNNQSITDAYYGDFSEIKQVYAYPGWKQNGYWNESIYGYYSQSDPWVLRKNLELLAVAGVDAICTDETNNAWVHTKGAFNMMRTMHKMMQEGIDAPKYVQILRWGDGINTKVGIENLYNSYFGSGLYSDTWYYHDGKPLIMAANTGEIAKTTGIEKIDSVRQEILDFFTFRPCHSGYKTVAEGEWWPWCSVSPQPGFNYQSDTGKYEMVAVSVAQNSNDAASSYTAMTGDGVYGRSYTYKDKFAKYSDSSVLYGYNYQEQWDNALKMDPENVFITGWNEWSATKIQGYDGIDNSYVDQFNDEYSRDIEPTKGQLKDNYYMQTVANIRRFKGVNPTPVASGVGTIDVSGDFSQWEGVGPEFVGLKGGTDARDYNGYGNYYTNNTGRNDIVTSKVTYDSENIYFYTETAENLTSYTGNNWMRLYINADRKYTTGWEGYDFIVNRVSPDGSQVVVEKNVTTNNNWKWEEVAKVDYKVSGNKLMLSIPRDVLGVLGGVDIEFKWHDNGVNDGDILDFYTNGDAAPVGRFNYRFVESALVNVPAIDEPVDPETNLDVITRNLNIFAIDEPYAYINGSRTLVDVENDDVTPVLIGSETFIPVDILARAYDAELQMTGTTAYVTIGEFKGRFKEGDKRITSDAAVVELKTAPTVINGKLYVPVRAFCTAFKLNCEWLEPGIILVGQKAPATVLVHNNIKEQLIERMITE